MSAIVNRIIVLAALSIFVAAPPLLASSVDAVTEVQRQLILKELQDKLHPPESDEKPSLPAGVSPGMDLPRMPDFAPRGDRAPREPLLVAVYGIDDNLVADIIYGSSIVSVKPGDMLDGWKIVDVFSARAVMEKDDERKELLLSMTGGSRHDEPDDGPPNGQPVDPMAGQYDDWAVGSF